MISRAQRSHFTPDLTIPALISILPDHLFSALIPLLLSHAFSPDITPDLPSSALISLPISLSKR